MRNFLLSPSMIAMYGFVSCALAGAATVIDGCIRTPHFLLLVSSGSFMLIVWILVTIRGYRVELDREDLMKLAKDGVIMRDEARLTYSPKMSGTSLTPKKMPPTAPRTHQQR